MASWNRIVDMITDHVMGVINANDESMAFLTGEVINVEPLRIKISDRFTLDENSLLLSALVKETWINIPAPTTLGEEGPSDDVFEHRHDISAQTEEANGHKHNIEITTKFALPKIRLWRGLVVGDVVRLIKVQGGQYYFVLEREETITNEKAEEGQDA